ncbi:MAG: preprotein translocase subunit SecE [Planctomycetaceae bacterium]|jgi:preprotein translocase SecE subunit|nr:preprotein translocase subunit SecE [Planctomycetaceae bacterium]
MVLLKELFRFRRYKSGLGRLIRRLTMAGIWVVFATAAWKCTQMDFTWIAGLAGVSPLLFAYGVAGVVLLCGLWLGFRLVNWETFADSLISVEGEMAKVSWPGKAELRSSTIVVLTVFLLLSAMIYIFDIILVFLFRLIHVT